MTSNLSLQYDGEEVGTVDLEALRPDDQDGDAEPRAHDPIDVSRHGFDGDGSGGDLAAFVADRAHEERPFVLPEGRYNWRRTLRFTGGSGKFDLSIPDRFALVGDPEATLTVDIDSDDPMHRKCFRFGTTRSPIPYVELRGLHIDVGEANPDRDAGIMRASVGSMYAADVSISQRCRLNADGSRNGDRHTYKCDVVDPEGTAIHKRIDLTAGDTHRPEANSVGHAIGFAAEPAHQGTNRWIDGRIAGYTDNGYYVRDGLGANILDGCLARNCGGGNIRLGYNDVARDCRVVVDGAESPASGAGIWLQGPSNTRVEGCRVDGPAMDNDALRVTHGPGSWSMRDVTVDLGDVGEYVLKASASRAHDVGDHAPATIAGLEVTDDCDGYVREAGVSLARPNVRVEGLHYDATGGRIPLACRARGLRVRDSTLRTHGAYAARLGSVLTGGQTADVVFDGVAFELEGADYLAGAYNDPTLRRLGVQNCDVDGGPSVLRHASTDDFDTFGTAGTPEL